MALNAARPHVLVVEDDPDLLDLYRDILGDAGYRVSVAAVPDSDEARRLHPDVVLLDYVFGRDPAGGAFVAALRDDPVTAALPVVICTAALEAVRAGRGPFADPTVRVVTKPFDIDDLLDALADARDSGGASGATL